MALFPQELSDGFGAGANLQFFVNAANVGVDGFVANAKFFGDFFVEKALAEAIENFLFALGEIFGRLWGRTGFLKGLSDFAGDVCGHGRTAAMNFENGFEQFGAFGAFEEVTVCARLESAEDIFCIFVNCQHDDLKFGNELFQLTNAFDSVDAREVDVHQDNFRADFGNLFDGFFGRTVMAEAFEAVSAVQDACESVSQLFVVFDDGNGYGHDERKSVT
jgi:hypothetical protein